MAHSARGAAAAAPAAEISVRPTMMDRCYECGRGMDPIVVRLGDPLPVMPSRMIYPTTSKGSIAFCDLCFEGQRFGALTDDDVERITWFFGAAFADEQPAPAAQTSGLWS